MQNGKFSPYWYLKYTLHKIEFILWNSIVMFNTDLVQVINIYNKILINSLFLAYFFPKSFKGVISNHISASVEWLSVFHLIVEK